MKGKDNKKPRRAYELEEWEHLIREFCIKALSPDQAIFLIKSFQHCRDIECGLQAMNFIDALIGTAIEGGNTRVA